MKSVRPLAVPPVAYIENATADAVVDVIYPAMTYRKDGVEEDVDDLPLVGLVVGVASLEARDPLDDVLPAVLGPFQLRLQDAGFQFGPQIFQFLQPLPGAAGEDTLLDGIEHVFNASLGVGQLTAEQRQGAVLGSLQRHQFVCDLGNQVVLEHPLDGVLHRHPLDPVLLRGLFVAAQPPFGPGAFVVAVDGAVASLAALADHQPAAVAAEQLRGQQIFFLGLCPGRGVLVLLHPLLHPFK